MQGQSDSKLTTKTEFMRYVDLNPTAIATIATSYYALYQRGYPRGKTFGFWLRQKHLPVFILVYRNYWLKHPELYGTIYQQNLLPV